MQKYSLIPTQAVDIPKPENSKQPMVSRKVPAKSNQCYGAGSFTLLYTSLCVGGVSQAYRIELRHRYATATPLRC